MVSQSSCDPNESASAVDEDWQIIPTDWWRTPLSSASWSYQPEKAASDFVCAKPPLYHLSLHNKRVLGFSDEENSTDDVLNALGEWHSSASCRIAGEDDVLNEELIGVKSANDVMRIYEQAVGFDCSPWPYLGSGDLEKRRRMCGCVSKTDIKSAKEQWDELVQDLFGGKSLQELLKEARANPKVKHEFFKNQLASSTTDTDYFSRPSTPKPFRLNPSASSFVPLGSPTSTLSSSSNGSSSDSSEHLNSFSFPSLNNGFPPAINKAHQEYVNSLPSRSRTSSSDSSSVASNDRSSSNFLPPFLIEPANQRRRPVRLSRTRAIVDQLRSQYHQDGVWTSPGSQNTSPTLSDFGVGSINNFNKSRLTVSDGSSVCSTTPPLTEEDHQFNDGVGVVGWNECVEGWTIPPAPIPVDPETKRSRSKELLMTLRRRTDSLSSSATSAASLSAARSLGVISASAPPITCEPERLVESPEPAEDTVAMNQLKPQAHREADDRCFDRSNPHQDIHSKNSHDFSLSNQDLTSTIPFNRTGSPQPTHVHPVSHNRTRRDSRTHSRTSSYSKSFPTSTAAAKYPAGYFANTSPGMPYTLLGFPLSVPGIPMSMPTSMPVPTIPMTMAMGASRGVPVPMSVPVPVQVPVQTMQYSTLMHLRIMQQMQMMRNSMGMSAGAAHAPATTR